MNLFLAHLANLAVAGVWVANLLNTPDGDSTIQVCAITAIVYAINARNFKVDKPKSTEAKPPPIYMG